MTNMLETRLKRVEELAAAGLDAAAAGEILGIIEGPSIPLEILERMMLYNETKIYAGATIMPGVTVGKQAVVAAGSIVNRDVPPNMMVAGTPARVIRERRNEGRSGDELDHIWLF